MDKIDAIVEFGGVDYMLEWANMYKEMFEITNDLEFAWQADAILDAFVKLTTVKSKSKPTTTRKMGI